MLQLWSPMLVLFLIPMIGVIGFIVQLAKSKH